MANIAPTLTYLRRNLKAIWSLTAGGTDTGTPIESVHSRKTLQCQLTGAGTLVIESSNDNTNWTTEDTFTATTQISYADHGARYWRIRQTAGTGTWVVTAMFEGAQ